MQYPGATTPVTRMLFWKDGGYQLLTHDSIYDTISYGTLGKIEPARLGCFFLLMEWLDMYIYIYIYIEREREILRIASAGKYERL